MLVPSNSRDFSNKGKAPVVPFHGITSTYKKFEFLQGYLVFRDHVLLGSAELKMKSLLTTPGNVLPLQHIKRKFKFAV